MGHTERPHERSPCGYEKVWRACFKPASSFDFAQDEA